MLLDTTVKERLRLKLLSMAAVACTTIQPSKHSILVIQTSIAYVKLVLISPQMILSTQLLLLLWEMVNHFSQLMEAMQQAVQSIIQVDLR